MSVPRTRPKRRLVEPSLLGEGGVLHTEVNELPVCMQGPVAVGD
jgi:hypothetical protein